MTRRGSVDEGSMVQMIRLVAFLSSGFAGSEQRVDILADRLPASAGLSPVAVELAKASVSRTPDAPIADPSSSSSHPHLLNRRP